MDRVFEPDRTAITNNRSIVMRWAISALLLLSVIWGGTVAKLQLDLREARAESMRLVSARARVYAEQLLRTVKAIDQISLTLKYQWQNMGARLDLIDQYAKAMHHTPTYPAAVGVDGRIISSWRKASIGLDLSQIDFFPYHRDNPDESLRINPPSMGVGGMVNKRTIRFTRRVNSADGGFAGIVLVSAEASYLASISNEDELHSGDFISVRLSSGPLMVARTVDNRESPQPFYRADPAFGSVQGMRTEPGERFLDNQPRYVAWQKIEGYPLVAIAAITDTSAVASYAPTRSAWLSFAAATSLLVLLAALSGGIMAVRNAERRRKAEHVRATFRLAVDGAREAFLMIDPVRDADGAITDYRIEDCNERAARLLRMPREQLLGCLLSQIFAGERLQQISEFFSDAFEQRFAESEYLTSGNEVHQPGWFYRRAVRSGDGIAVTIRDITDAKLHEQALTALTVTDTLTGLPNRRWLNDYLPGALQRARAARKRVALLFLDLDNFKTINDTYGHAAGDDLLRAAALCLKGAVRGSDHVARLGGDEFTVLLENLERDADAELVAAQIVKVFASSDSFAQWAALEVSCSVGIALYPAHAQDADSLLQCADNAMYDAKKAGKNRYSMFRANLPVTEAANAAAGMVDHSAHAAHPAQPAQSAQSAQPAQPAAGNLANR